MILICVACSDQFLPFYSPPPPPPPKNKKKKQNFEKNAKKMVEIKILKK